MITIVLDPGHGGPSHPSVVGGSSWNNATGPTGLLEKTVTLQVAKAAAAALSGMPVNVVLTRSTDVNLGIVARAAVAKTRAAEVFVSIHFNAPEEGAPAAQGTETWISPTPSAHSRRLAENVQAAVVKATGYRDRRVKNSTLVSGVVNNSNHSPKTAHCLVEISFLTRQPAEEARLKTPEYITYLGRAVRDGIVSYCIRQGLLQQESAESFASEEAEDAASARRLGLIADSDRDEDDFSEQALPDYGVQATHDESWDDTHVCEAAGDGADEGNFEESAASKPPVDRRETTTHKSSRNGTDIDHIVIHYTTSRSIEGTIRHFKTGSPRTSAHYIIGRDGTLVQIVPDGENAWHSGKSEMNRRSIGIEHVAAPGDKITETQGRTSIALIRWLMSEYDVPLANVIPHVCVKPTSCCGDLFKDYGGGADLSCAKQKAALHRWLAANGIGGNGHEFVEAVEVAGRWNREEFAEVAPPAQRRAMGKAIVRFEARRDERDRIKVYHLPAIDGGGAFEVAGINVRYHRDQAWALRRLVEAGRHAEAEDLACEYIAQYTDRAAAWCSNAGVEFYLRDCVFNRGPTGAARILQRALRVHVDGLIGSQTLAAVAAAEAAGPLALLLKLREAREAYEREVVGIRPKFKRGLENRWNKALEVAKTFL